MSTSKKHPPQSANPSTSPTTPAAEAPRTDDVLLDTPTSSVTIGADGTVDAATTGTEPLKAESIKHGITGAATTLANNLEGGDPGLPKDPVAFSRSFYVMTQLLSLFTGFHTFMTTVRRPQDAKLVPAAAAAVQKNWALLLRLVPAALADLSINNITALTARLSFVQTMLKHVGTLNDRLLTVQSHLEDQLITQLRPLYDRGQALFLSHDDLVDPMDPLVQLFALSGQKAAEARRNNLKVTDAALSAAAEKPAPAAPGSATSPGIVLTPGTVTSPGAVALSETAAQPVKAQAAPTAAKKSRTRG